MIEATMSDDDARPPAPAEPDDPAAAADADVFGGVPTPAELAGNPAGGEALIRINLVLTAVFVVSAVLAAVVFDDATRVQGVVVALTLFTIGVFTFLGGYFVAVGRSRTQEMAVAELYLLMGNAIPRRVKRPMLGALAVQVVVALATAIARPSTDGTTGSTLAFGVLVPMLGLGLNGLWSAKYATFGPRRRRGVTPDTEEGRDVPPAPDEMD